MGAENRQDAEAAIPLSLIQSKLRIAKRRSKASAKKLGESKEKKEQKKKKESTDPRRRDYRKPKQTAQKTVNEEIMLSVTFFTVCSTSSISTHLSAFLSNIENGT